MSELRLTFGIIVTGVGEAKFLPKMFQSLRNVGPFTFFVLGRIGQLSPRKSQKGAGKLTLPNKPIIIPGRDEELGLKVRGFLQESENHFVLVVDDLEYDRLDTVTGCFRRYREAIDTIVTDSKMNRRASVHFLVMMLESYFFADAQAVNKALGAEVLASDYLGDVETIRHPKNDLKALFAGFDEVRHGDEIIGRLDVVHVLSNPNTCTSLRTLFAWCVESILEYLPDFQGVFPEYHLDGGKQSSVTNGQLSVLKCDALY